jgi:competence protein ComEA
MVGLPPWLKYYFTFHRKERNGLIVLLVLIALVISAAVALRVVRMQYNSSQLLVFGPSIARFNTRIDSLDHHRPDNGYSSSFSPQTSTWDVAERFSFDPNTLDSAGWVRLGFSPKQAASIIRYRSKGAKFYRPEDLLRLYMMDSARYLDLLPFISIAPLPQTRSTAPFPHYERPAPVMVDINLADTLQLTSLRGIGPAFARRIFRYRQRLGGFRSVHQLYEVYGMDSMRVQAILPFITIDTTVLTRININTADFKQLIQNPYFNKNQVSAIISYRERHGSYRHLTDLKRIHLITEETYVKVAPHLTVQ